MFYFRHGDLIGYLLNELGYEFAEFEFAEEVYYRSPAPEHVRNVFCRDIEKFGERSSDIALRRINYFFDIVAVPVGGHVYLRRNTEVPIDAGSHDRLFENFGNIISELEFAEIFLRSRHAGKRIDEFVEIEIAYAFENVVSVTVHKIVAFVVDRDLVAYSSVRNVTEEFVDGLHYELARFELLEVFFCGVLGPEHVYRVHDGSIEELRERSRSIAVRDVHAVFIAYVKIESDLFHRRADESRGNVAHEEFPEYLFDTFATADTFVNVS